MEYGKGMTQAGGLTAEKPPQAGGGTVGAEPTDKEKKESRKLKKRQKKAEEKSRIRSQKVAEKAAERVAASHAAKAVAEKEAAKALRESLRKSLKRQEQLTARAEAENRGEVSMYERFRAYSFLELEGLLRAAESREEKAFYRSLLNLKLQIEQEKVIGEVLL